MASLQVLMVEVGRQRRRSRLAGRAGGRNLWCPDGRWYSMLNEDWRRTAYSLLDRLYLEAVVREEQGQRIKIGRVSAALWLASEIGDGDSIRRLYALLLRNLDPAKAAKVALPPVGIPPSLKSYLLRSL